MEKWEIDKCRDYIDEVNSITENCNEVFTRKAIYKITDILDRILDSIKLDN
jgi:hypothetical protein